MMGELVQNQDTKAVFQAQVAAKKQNNNKKYKKNKMSNTK